MIDARYMRQYSIIGVEGQDKLNNSSVAIVGAGGLGCPISLYLVAGGIGKITLIDNDNVDLSNLQRQVLFGEEDIGSPKVEVAKKRLKAINSRLNIVIHQNRLTKSNAESYLKGHDLVIDGCDNYDTRYLVNDVCCQLNQKFLSASVLTNTGQSAYFDIQNGCYRCLFPEPPPSYLSPNCAEAGVLGALVGVIGTLAATMAIDILLGNVETYRNKFYTFGSLPLKLQEFKYSKDASCPSCVSKTELSEETNLTQEQSNKDGNIEIELSNPDDLKKYTLIDVRADWEYSLIKLEGSKNIPLQTLIVDLPNMDIATDKPILIVCKSGARSLKSARYLRENNYNSVFSLQGGMIEWCKHNKLEMPY